jgi:hypothetical protein
MAEGGPNLPRERRDRGLAARAGDGRDGCGLAGKDFRCDQRQGPPGIAGAHEGDAGRQRRFRRPLREDRAGAGSDCRADEFQTVGFAALNGDEQVARFDGTRIHGDAAHVEIGTAGLDDSVRR